MSEGERVLLVEDLTTDGGSKLSFVDAIRDTGATCGWTAGDFLLRDFPRNRKDAWRSRGEADFPVHMVGRSGRGQASRRLCRRYAGAGRDLPQRSARMARGAQARLTTRSRERSQKSRPTLRRGFSFGTAGLAGGLHPRGELSTKHTLCIERASVAMTVPIRGRAESRFQARNSSGDLRGRRTGNGRLSRHG